DVVDGPHHARPHLGEKADVAGVAIDLGDREDELAVAVVLGHGIGAAAIDAARYPSISSLVRSEPFDEAPGLAGESRFEQRRRGERPVADPRTGVVAWAGLQARPVTIDEDVAERALDRADEARGVDR